MVGAMTVGKNGTLQNSDIALLKGEFAGALIIPGGGDYEVARRVWNGNIDRKPALIARCAGTNDVRKIVNFVRERGLVLSVRGGGHSAPGYGTNDGGVVIDLSLMKGIRVDAGKRIAHAEGGVIWSELDRATQEHGLATTGGTVSNTGIGGLTLGGGLGWLMGKHGASIDNLLSVVVVTADGQVQTASEKENPDLFWALRGGSGNFGVVTSFEYRLHPVSQVLGGLVLYPLDQARDVLRFYRDFCPTLPDEAEAYAALLTTPDGILVVALLLGYNGLPDEGMRVLAPLRGYGRPLVDTVGLVPYSARQCMLDQPMAVHGLHRYWRSAFTETVSDELIDVLVARAAAFSSPLNSLILFYVHGAVTRVPEGATAFSARKAQWDFDAIGQWTDGSESATHIAWVRDAWDALEPHLQGRVYVNHVAADDRPEKVRASFGGNYKRLRELKTRYDPTNLFRMNANIAPG